MSSQLGFDKWQSTAGVDRNTVVQTVQYHYTNRWTQAAANGLLWYDTPVVVTIKPKFANSKIIGMFTGVLGTGYWELQGRIIRNGTTVVQQGDVEGSRSRAGFSMIYYDYNSTSHYNTYNIAYNFVDTPNSTSDVTYRLQLNAYSTYTIVVNGVQLESNNFDHDGCPTTQLTLMEITQ
jgi:hypothetical protein